MAEDTRPRRFAVLIDADNTSSRIVDGLFEEIARFGEASVRRIYGDFSSPRLKSWTEVLQKHAIDPYQQFAYTSGKNASDIALVIDAMDLLHSGRFDGFCLVSSDSDFTRLASRLREEGADVYGFGAQKTPESFRQACRRFIYTENLVPEFGGTPSRRAVAARCSRRVPRCPCWCAPSSRWRPRMAGSVWARSASGWPPSPRTSIRAPTAIASFQTLCATPARSRSTSPAAASCASAPSRRGPPPRRAAAEPEPSVQKRACPATGQDPCRRHDAANDAARAPLLRPQGDPCVRIH